MCITLRADGKKKQAKGKESSGVTKKVAEKQLGNNF